MIALSILKWLVIVIVVLAILLLIAGQLGLLKGSEPAGLGVKDGKLKRISATENSVSSQASLYPESPMRQYADIAPLRYTGDTPAAMQRLHDIVHDMNGATVVKTSYGYLYAQYQTQWLKFIDDVEFVADEDAKVIHVRSASRVGRKDLGVNRARVEEIRRRFK
jgi:uncharacterized protein (DUF1499 family)